MDPEFSSDSHDGSDFGSGTILLATAVMTTTPTPILVSFSLTDIFPSDSGSTSSYGFG